jgi:hypothetical protein
MTSIGAPLTILAQPGSVMDPIGTSYAGANSVYLRYCTSDGYIGDRAASLATGGLAFRGRRVVEATIAALGERHGLGRTPRNTTNSSTTTVLYSGCSAGGRGVMHNLNTVARQVKSLAGPDARVVGLIDSGLYIDMDPLAPSEGGGPGNATALAEQAKGIVSYTRAAIDPHCASIFPGEQRYRCLLGEYAIGNGTLLSPHLVHAFQYDAYQLCILLNLSPANCWALTAEEVAEHRQTWEAPINEFRQRTRGVLFGHGSAAHGLAVHSAACYKHCNTESAAFSTGYMVSGISLAATLDRFAFGGEHPSLVENCSGFSCGADCRPSALKTGFSNSAPGAMSQRVDS